MLRSDVVELASREGLIGPANQPKTGNGGKTMWSAVK
jgi:hypothetical protein